MFFDVFRDIIVSRMLTSDREGTEVPKRTNMYRKGVSISINRPGTAVFIIQSKFVIHFLCVPNRIPNRIPNRNRLILCAFPGRTELLLGY
jgi:hypothetical protein